MATLTIRNLEDAIKERLRVRTALHGRSMEEEARDILRKAVGVVTGPGLWERSRSSLPEKKASSWTCHCAARIAPRPALTDASHPHDPA